MFSRATGGATCAQARRREAQRLSDTNALEELYAKRMEQMERLAREQSEEAKRLRTKGVHSEHLISKLQRRVKDLLAQIDELNQALAGRGRSPTPARRVGGGYEYEGSPRWMVANSATMGVASSSRCGSRCASRSASPPSARFEVRDPSPPQQRWIPPGVPPPGSSQILFMQAQHEAMQAEMTAGSRRPPLAAPQPGFQRPSLIGLAPDMPPSPPSECVPSIAPSLAANIALAKVASAKVASIRAPSAND